MSDQYLVLEKSLAFVEAVAPLLPPVARRDRSLRDQLRRAAQSVALNVAEAAGVSAGSKRVRLETALGSAYETRTILRIAVAWGYLDANSTAPALALLDEVAAMTYRRLHPVHKGGPSGG